jgi:N-glycosylase/DNA lyase
MNSDANDSTGGPGPDSDTGQPIRVLSEQEYETSSDFMVRVRSKIYRRTAASQFASYSWQLPKVVLLEMARVLGHLFTALGAKKES